MKSLSYFLKNRFKRAPSPAAPISESTATAMPSYFWYGLIEGDDIEQGDIFEDCPVFLQPDEVIETDASSTFTYGKLDLIVMSQSCDLVKGREKIEQVSLCVLFRKSEFKTGGKPVPASTLEQVRLGRLPRYHMIASSEIPGFACEIRIIDLQLRRYGRVIHLYSPEVTQGRNNIGRGRDI